MEERFAWSIDRLWDGQPALPAEHASIAVTFSSSGLVVEVDAPFHNDPAPPGPKGAHPGLWEFEVVELFLLGDEEQYLEIEVGPHGHHWVLEMQGRRQPRQEGLAMSLVTEFKPGRWQARATLPISHLPAGCSHANAYAIHGLPPSRRFLAAHPVPGREPDFHRLEHFQAFRGLPLGE